MNDMSLPIADVLEAQVDAKPSCFLTENHHIYATDLEERVYLSTDDQEILSKTIRDIFLKLKQSQHADPILIGVIPFDTTKPATLNFYRHYRKIEKTTFDDQQYISHYPCIEFHQQQRLVQQTHFNQMIDLALQQFASHHLQKVVLSQAIDFELVKPENPFALGMILAQKNPQAFSFVVPVEGGAHLLGASPELLISKQGKSIRSNPLAGSRPISHDGGVNQHRVHELYHSAKDLYEHRIVVDSVLSNLRPYCTQLKFSDPPEIIKTSTMLHLSTVFEGQLKSEQANALQLALALHPTPAICGSPTALAKDFILKNEGYDRHYYTGLVGWMDSNGNGEWVVTIRCGLLSEKRIRLYAGAGIVTGSEAELEWNETEAKMQTILKTLNVKVAF
ncbi:isochorismate synthase [Acinetobacter rudis]|uniref:isochorismate synthase n=1 Tax=Acinetobacter rudis TaxID=632955 RepID=A0AAW8JBA4_9GAMM|nr:isochorismate synthase [Acinetobacter rudis]MDQ8936227.1 isochorismate synthase [Acinetobacter rudis]MDQ8953941.1 isochorismate synthase [Acinetobacter rudis]MDQ9018490.1 isochorismate synthase [Acinetobacter rudis]